MTQEEKGLLLKDLLGRILYGVTVDYRGNIFTLGYSLYLNNGDVAFENYPMLYSLENIESIKPYLRPMSSMTEKEENDLKKITWQFNFDRKFNSLWVGAADDGGCTLSEMTQIITYLLSHHFDYYSLIEKGLALEAPEDMYKN